MRVFIAKYKLLIVMIIGCLMGTAYAEGNTANTEKASALIQLSWVGCDITRKLFINELATAYSLKSGVEIKVQDGGATQGIRDTLSGQSDMGGTSRYKLALSEIEKNAILKPVAWDALVVITHPDNTLDNITMKQLRGVLTGKITNWNQLAGKSGSIKLFAREGKFSGVGRTVRKLVFADYGKEFKADELFQSSDPLEAAVEADKDAIAITYISSARKLNVKILKFEGKIPDYKNIMNGSYVLYHPLYMVVNATGKHVNLVEGFYKFTHSPKGREILRENGTVPYLDALSLVMKQVEQDERAMGRGVYRN